MPAYSQELKQRIKDLRYSGHTYPEIQIAVGQAIPKSTLNYICKGIILSEKQQQRISSIMREQLVENRKKAVVANRKILTDKIEGYKLTNQDLSCFMQDRQAKLVALAMLYLGEGAKWKGRRGLQLGSSDPLIIRLYINLLRDCYNIPLASLKARVQHRADQDSSDLEQFWSSVTGIGSENFYPSYVDKRTIGKVTKKTDYKGVCSISCAGTHVQPYKPQDLCNISAGVRNCKPKCTRLKL